jgi:hypothetical protein
MDQRLPAMKRIALICTLCLLTAVSQATFEMEEPAQMVEDFQKEQSEAFERGKLAADTAEAEVIVTANTNLYTPGIIEGECTEWSIDKSEPYLDENQQTQFTSKTTYIGRTIKTIDCTNPTEGESLQLLLIKTRQGRLIWVESGKVLSSD